MKVAFTFLTFGKNIFAGMENSIYQLCMGINEIGHEAVVFTSYNYGKEKVIDGIKIQRSKYLPTDFTGGDSALRRRILANKHFIINDLLKFINTEKPNCIVSWDPLWGFIQYLDIHKIIDTPTILFFRVVNSQRILQTAKNTPFKKHFALSEFLKEEISKKGIISEIEVIPNSIDYSFFSKKVINNHRKKIVFCNARLSPEKGIPYAIRAFAKVIKSHPDFELWLCSGEFPFGDVNKTRQKVTRIIKKLKIENKVIFLPNIDWNEIPALIGQAFVSILPSLTETFGRSVLESLAVGTPVIATTVGNLSKLVGTDGILIEPKSSEQLYSNLIKLIEDKQFYNHYLERGRKRAKQFDRKIIAKRFINSLNKI